MPHAWGVGLSKTKGDQRGMGVFLYIGVYVIWGGAIYNGGILGAFIYYMRWMVVSSAPKAWMAFSMRSFWALRGVLRPCM